MTHEPPMPPPEGWTVHTVLTYLRDLIIANDRRYEERFDALQESFEHRFAAQEKSVSAALMAADRAVTKAEVGAEKRFESVNEFRNTLADQQRNLMPRAETESALLILNRDISEIKTKLDGINAEGRGIRGGWGYAVGVIGLVAGIAGFVMMLVALMKMGQ